MLTLTHAANRTDTELVAACLRGEPKAQRLLYERFAAKMLACCMRYCGNRADAEDCLLQGFEKVFRNLASYQAEGPLEGWVRRIMVREALQMLRRRSLLFVQTSAVADDAASELAAEAWSEAASHLEVEDVLAAVATLPDHYRTIFNLAVVEGFGHEEIAAMLGMAEATSRSHLFRARQLLQRRLAAEEAQLRRTHR